MEILKVSSSSNPGSVAGAIAGLIREEGKTSISVQAVGAGAVNQSVKALAIANSFLKKDNIELFFVPSFNDIDVDGEERTAICFKLGLKKD